MRWTWNRLDESVDVLTAFLLAGGVRAGTGAVGVVTATGYGEHELAGAALGLIGAAAPPVRFAAARGDDEPAGALAWPENSPVRSRSAVPPFDAWA